MAGNRVGSAGLKPGAYICDGAFCVACLCEFLYR